MIRYSFILVLLFACSKNSNHPTSGKVEKAMDAKTVKDKPTLKVSTPDLELVAAIPNTPVTDGNTLTVSNIVATSTDIKGQSVLKIQVDADSQADYLEYGVCPVGVQDGNGCSLSSADGYGEFEPSAGKFIVDIQSGNYSTVVRACVRYYHSKTQQPACGDWFAQIVAFDASNHNDDVKNAILLQNSLEKKLVVNCTASYALADSYQGGASEGGFDHLVKNFLNLGIDGCVQIAETGMLQAVEAYVSQTKDSNPFGVFVLGAGIAGLPFVEYTLLQTQIGSHTKLALTNDAAVVLPDGAPPPPSQATGHIQSTGSPTPQASQIKFAEVQQSLKDLKDKEDALKGKLERFKWYNSEISTEDGYQKLLQLTQPQAADVQTLSQKNWSGIPNTILDLEAEADGSGSPSSRIHHELSAVLTGVPTRVQADAAIQAALADAQTQLDAARGQIQGSHVVQSRMESAFYPDMPGVIPSGSPDSVPSANARAYTDNHIIHFQTAPSGAPEATHSVPLRVKGSGAPLVRVAEAAPELLSGALKGTNLTDASLSPQQIILSEMSDLYSQILQLTQAIVTLNQFLSQ